MDRTIKELEQRAAVREAKAQAESEEKLKERQRKEQETGKKPSGRAPKPPKTGAENSNEQAHLTDADARIMHKNKRAGFTESYNAQAAVDADGSQLIVGEHVSQSASDNTELANGRNSNPAETGKPKAGHPGCWLRRCRCDRTCGRRVSNRTLCECASRRCAQRAHLRLPAEEAKRTAYQSNQRPTTAEDVRQVTNRRRQSALCRAQSHGRDGLWHHQSSDGISRIHATRARESERGMDSGVFEPQPEETTPTKTRLK